MRRYLFCQEQHFQCWQKMMPMFFILIDKYMFEVSIKDKQMLLTPWTQEVN